ncbi:MAG: hypothetical protein ACTHJR_16010 [Sphingomonas sp.]|uniref:hypothetical protein n=1 Tax=Sphingomonas sp. TaxID=28214 RepID=UPI003F7E47F6
MMSSAWRDDESDEWETALERPYGRPWVAMLAGTGAILVIAIVTMNLVPFEIASHGAGALGAVTVLAAAVWGVAWFLTLRDATPGWRIGVGAVLWGVALLTVAGAIGYANLAVRIDIANVRRIRIDVNGDPHLPPGNPGPVTQTMFDFIHTITSEQHQRLATFQVMGMDRLNDALAVTNTPGMLKDCGRFTRVAPEITASDQRVADAVRRVHERLAAVVRDESLRAALIKDFDKGLDTGRAAMRQSSALQRRQLELGSKLCTFLATHHWRPQGSHFMFYSGSDLAGFDASTRAWNDAVEEQNALSAQARRKMAESGLLDAPVRY